MLLLTACSSLPQAVTSPVVPVADVAPLAAPPAERTHRWNLHDSESRIEIESGELMASFRSTVPSFRGFISSNPERAVIDFDLRSLHNDSRVVAAIIQDDYLEVDKYPIAHVDVVVRDGKARGTLELHGVRRNIEFPVTVERTPGRVRIRSAFTLKRHDFGIVKLSGWDWIAREDVAIGFDLVAVPERVVVEELP